MKPCSLLLTLAMFAVPQLTFAQQAPTGEHYGGRASDTGTGGSLANVTGSFAASIPLALPAERVGLPVPLQIVYGGHGVGAAGLGWDIPFSYIQVNKTFAHRRPAYGQNTPPQARERMFLSLLGRGGDLVKTGSQWVVRTGTLELTVRDGGRVVRGGRAFVAYDGSGRTYTFIKPTELDSAGLWLLYSVSAAGGASVQLTYQITAWPLDGLDGRPGGGTGLEVNLEHLAYNTSSFPNCAKHEIVLTYGNPSTPPMSLSMLGETALVRFHTLTRVDVNSRDTCATPLQSLRYYELQYVQDPDTQLNTRLSTVRMFGREGTPERATPLPIASYEYGSATSGGALRYDGVHAQTVALPPEDDGTMISGTLVDGSVGAPGSGERYAMWQSLIDVTGDGRPDFVYEENGKLRVFMNSPAPGGTTAFGTASLPLQDSTFSAGPLSTHTTTSRRLWYGSANRNTVDVWRQAIDVNGDGRIDIVDAGEQAERWIVYLNRPGPNGIQWERRSFSVHNLALELAHGGHAIDGGYVPLARRTTGVSVNVSACLKGQGANWVPFSGTFLAENGGPSTFCVDGHPSNWQPPAMNCYQDGPCAPPPDEPEKTFVEWELSDLNGDGYPDVVFNEKPVEFAPHPTADGLFSNPDNHHDRVFVGTARNVFQLGAGNTIRAAFNVVGVRFDVNEPSPFSQSVSLNAPNAESGVGLWAAVDGAAGTQREFAGFADVNGDGLADRVVDNKANLGVYTDQTHALSSVYLTIPSITIGAISQPGILSEQWSEQKAKCPLLPASSAKFDSGLNAGFRDLTGDGIPDYFSHGQVAIGTGAGFAPFVPVMSSPVRFEFSHQSEACDGHFSHTDGGLFDLDGDGKPEVIGLVHDERNPPHWFYLVTQLAGSNPRSPEAGRLTVVDNGYGASTRIGYRSAKDDLYSSHQVPFPEIVVGSVETVGTQNLGGSLAGTRYAYGNAQMIFDSARDAFVFPGYGRTVELALYPGPRDTLEGAPTVTDNWSVPQFVLGTSKPDLWVHLRRGGHVSDTYTLRGSPEIDPWPFLHIDANDSRIIGVGHTDWDARLFEEHISPPNLRDCVEMVDPYDFSISFAAAIGSNGLNSCGAHGFAFANSFDSWYGSSPPPSASNVHARASVTAVDEFGRTVSARYDNDLYRGDDDVCIQNTFAAPTGTFPRVLTALSSRRVLDCYARTLFANGSWSYDGLAIGQVSLGRLTSHTVDRRATDNGSLVRSVHMFDASYDAAGSLATVRTQRDAATRTVTFAYDPFGLVPVSTRVDATGLPSMASTSAYDPVSLERLETVGVNGTHTGAEFDGFGRPLRTTVRPPGGPLGVLSTLSYEGFAGGDPNGRRIVAKAFSDPVAPANASSTVGRTGTVFLDEVGRGRRTEIALGSDYANSILVVGARTYDAAGRVAFAADPYPSGQSSATPYGTSYLFKNTGDLDCIIRGRGPQRLNKVTDIANERLPTCFNRWFDYHAAALEVQDAASLQANSPQTGVVHRVVSSAIGWTLEQSTVRAGAPRLEHATIGHDRLGQQTSITRFRDPAAAADPVLWSRRLDSTGRVLLVTEPEAAAVSHTYSDWGEPVETRWTDGATDRRLLSRFDALSRLTSTEGRDNNTVDAQTVNTYAYDVAATGVPHLSPTFVLGRLSRASSPSGQVAFSYDAFGRVNARAFTDDEAGLYIDRFDYHGDGSLATLGFNLPDRNYDDELIKYGYDSAGRLRSIVAPDASGATSLYKAGEIDVVGRVRKAFYGANTQYSALYAEEGRRLIKRVEVASPSGSRRFLFPKFDAVGRELARQEIKGGGPGGLTSSLSFGPLGQLNSTQATGPTPPSEWKFSYDALGNVTALNELAGMKDATLTYRTNDRDRICRISYGSGGGGGGPCNVTHDVLGNITTGPTRTGSRQLTYFPSGGVRSIAQDGISAKFAYDAFGQIQKLDIQGGTDPDQRQDRHYGGLIERRDVISSGSSASQIVRHVPGAGGIVATRLGPGDQWIFGFGELRGNRFFTNRAGGFVQDVDYQPFGEASSTGAGVGTADYTSYQWNGGDALAAFGLSRLGARLYDPVIGRFLSRDPLQTANGATVSNPYAFAINDPVNSADPSGLDCVGEGCTALPPPPWYGGGPSGSGTSGTSGAYPTTLRQPGPTLEALDSGLVGAPRPELPQTEAGRTLWNESLIRNGTVPRGLDWDAYALNPASGSDKLESIANNMKDIREIDALNAELDQAAANFRGAGIGILAAEGLIVGGGLVVEAVTPEIGTGLVHLTTREAGVLINESGVLTRSIYAGPVSNASATGARVLWRTGLGAFGAAVRIPAAGEAAFSRVLTIGPVTLWQWMTGQQYTARGMLDLSTGEFFRLGVNWNQVFFYGFDATITTILTYAGLNALPGATEVTPPK